MHCSFCPETNRSKATMSVNNFENVARQIAQYTDYVYLHVKGEPLLHPQLKEILDICKRYNLKVNISTNGTLLSEKYLLLKEIRQLNISLHSFEDNNDEKLNSYLSNILNCVDYLVKEGVIVRYKLWNAQNGKDNNKIIEVLENWYNLKITTTSYNKDIKLKDKVFLSIKAPFKWPDLQDETKDESTCYGLRQQIAILVDGTVVPCCVDNNGNINLGNIFENSLEEILNTDIVKQIQTGFENNKCVHDLCKKCEYRIGVI